MWREGGTRPSSEEHDFTSLSFFSEPLPSFPAPFVVPLHSCQTNSNFPDTDPIKKTFRGVKCMKQVHMLQEFSLFADLNSHQCLIS